MPVGKVDRENKIIHGYTVMSLGEAIGHGFIVDEQTLDRLVELGNQSPNGVKTRVRHREGADDGFGRYLGPSKNFRREGDRTVADMHLSSLAFKSLSGDLGSYVMDMAETADSMFGASPEIVGVKERKGALGLPVMRPTELLAIAIVDDPATNTGFFSLSAKEDDAMSLEEQLAQMTAERNELQGKLAKLEADHKTAVDGHVTALSAARTEATKAGIDGERARAGDIIALCGKAKQIDLSSKFITDGVSKETVQEHLFTVLCSSNRPIGEGTTDENFGGGGKSSSKDDPNAVFKKEYVALSAEMKKAGVSEEEYIATRRVDVGLDTLSHQS